MSSDLGANDVDGHDRHICQTPTPTQSDWREDGPLSSLPNDHVPIEGERIAQAPTPSECRQRRKLMDDAASTYEDDGLCAREQRIRTSEVLQTVVT